MLKRILLALAVLAVGLTAVVVSRPSTYRVERTTSIAAPAELVFGLLNDFHRWRYWSPWEQPDPQLRRGYDGSYAGPGAIYTWAGDPRAGRSQATLLESELYTSLRIQLERAAPGPSMSQLDFTLQPEAGGLTVRWGLEGRRTFLDKARALVENPETRIGEDLEKGLATLKTLAETEVKNRAERDALIKARDDAARAPSPPPPAVAPTP